MRSGKSRLTIVAVRSEVDEAPEVLEFLPITTVTLRFCEDRRPVPIDFGDSHPNIDFSPFHDPQQDVYHQAHQQKRECDRNRSRGLGQPTILGQLAKKHS